jgi:hypothetical protein
MKKEIEWFEERVGKKVRETSRPRGVSNDTWDEVHLVTLSENNIHFYKTRQDVWGSTYEDLPHGVDLSKIK